MVNNVEELKNLILWLKKTKVKSLKLGETVIELSDLALIEDLQDATAAPQAPKEDQSTKEGGVEELTNVSEPNEDEEILFHSARP